MKCDFCGNDSNEASLIIGKRKRICEKCIGQVVDVILQRKATNLVDIGDNRAVCDICESENSIFYFNKNQLHICVSCISTCLETLAFHSLSKHLEGTPYKQVNSGIKNGSNFNF
jgi:hypothetical protein